MLTRLNQWWSHQPYHNATEKRLAYLVFLINLIVLGAYGLVSLISLYWRDWPVITICLVAGVLHVIPVLFLVRGKLQAGNFLTALIVLGLVTGTATVGQGIHDFALMAYPVVLTIASLIADRRRVILISLWTLASIVWLVFGETHGWYVPRPFETPNLGDVLIVATILAMALLGINLLASDLRKGLAQAHQELAEREQTERELEQYRKHLEDMVAERTATLQQEIVERRQAEERLTASEQKYRRLFESSHDAIALHHPDGTILDVNARYCELIGYSKAALSGMKIFDFHPADLRRVNQQNMPTLLKTGAIRFETQIECADQHIIDVEISASFADRSEGLIQAIIRDITARKQTEETLRQAKEAAEFANLAKTNFLRSVSHELRTPLNHILNFAWILAEQLRETLNPRQTNYLNTILESGAHLLMLIDDILRLSQLDFGKYDLQYAPIALKPLLENSVKYIREKDLKQHLTLAIKLSPDLEATSIEADSTLLKQVVFQLVANAVKFTPDGGTITLEAQYHAPDLVISVSDTGMGIAPEYQALIFEPFYQIRGGLVDKTPGTGLGLTIARRLVELHGGKLWVTSAGLGQGSRFSVSIPSKIGLSASAGNSADQAASLSADAFTQYAAALVTLPADTQAGLREAVNTADLELAHAMIARIRPRHEALADVLAKLVDNYRFDLLLTLLQTFQEENTL